MKKSTICISVAALLLIGAAFLHADQEAPPTQDPTGTIVSKAAGGSMQTKLGFNIVLNDKSTLIREWITIHNSILPADLVGDVGVTTKYADRSYEYEAKMPITFRETCVAVEVRFLLFDVWGEMTRALSMTRIQDFPAGDIVESASWRLLSENECSEFYASIAYVARVRTADGRVIAMPLGPVLEESKRFSSKLSLEDLEGAND